MDGRSSELAGAVRAGAFPIVEAVLLVLTVAVVYVSADAGASELPWALTAIPFLFALVVVAHRVRNVWRAVRERRWSPDSAIAVVAGVWAALEVVAAVGFLVLSVVFAVGLLTTAATLSGGVFALTIHSVFGAAAMLILLVVAVAARLVATSIVRLGGRAAAR